MFIEFGSGYFKDSDFGFIFVNPDITNGWIAVCEEYHKRNLDAGKNLFIAIKWFCDTHRYTISDMGAFVLNILAKHNNMLYDKYAKDVEKYLLLA